MLTLNRTNPTARKAHICGWCNGTIHPGEQYHRSTNVGDDGLYDWIACAPCSALCPIVWEWAGRPDEGIAEDSYAEWASDHLNDPAHGELARAYRARRNAR